MRDLTIVKHSGGGYIDSREVAELVGKRHDHLLRDIAGYCKTLEKSTAPNFGVSDFFVENTYEDKTRRTLPCYLISKMGCEMIANKLTGEKGILFTATYVAKFNEMEKQERQTLAATDFSSIDELTAGAKTIIQAMQKMGVLPEQIQPMLMTEYRTIGISCPCCDKFEAIPRMYTAKDIAEMLGLYSMSGKPHYQAVSAILNDNITMGESHKIVINTGNENHPNVRVHYDKYAAEAVEDWLSEMDYPHDIYASGHTYHILYQD